MVECDVCGIDLDIEGRFIFDDGKFGRIKFDVINKE